MRSYMDDALDAIAGAGPLASVDIPGATVWRLCEWLDWPSWIRNGTSLTGEGPLPHKVTYADRLIITANLMEYGDIAYLLDRTFKGPQLPLSPVSTLMFRNAPTLGELLQEGLNVAPVGSPHHAFSYQRVGDKMVYEFHAVMPMGRLAALHEVFFAALVYAQVVDFVFDKIRNLKIELTLTDDHLSKLVCASFPCDVKFGQESNRLIFPSEWADLRNEDSDEALWLVAKERKEAVVRSDASTTIARIRERITQIISESHRVPRQEEIAEELGVSIRTVVRIIAASGTTYQAILEEERRVLAAKLINDASLSLDAVAKSLGYSGLPSFNRAFRNWFGVTPGAMRKGISR